MPSTAALRLCMQSEQGHAWCDRLTDWSKTDRITNLFGLVLHIEEDAVFVFAWNAQPKQPARPQS
jgi:hypothetical protein